MARILVVDDDSDLRELLSLFLVGSGFDVTEACSVRDALRKVRETEFDAILTDGSLGDGDAWDLLEALEAREIRPKIVFLITGHNDLIGTPGFDEYLIKPVNPTDILMLLRTHLRLSSNTNRKSA